LRLTGLRGLRADLGADRVVADRAAFLTQHHAPLYFYPAVPCRSAPNMSGPGWAWLGHMASKWLVNAGLGLMAGVLCLPVLALVLSWLQLDATSLQVLWEQAQTVLPEHLLTSAALCVAVGVGVWGVGVATAGAVTLFDFPGRRTFEWLLLLPLAMPAYVLAYAYTDFLQYSGPVQSALRAWGGWSGRMLPEIRSVGGAALLFVLALYPYVYLLARAALAERANHLMEAARMLGVPLRKRIRFVALPLARPAVAAGVALALMETLADFGVGSYFGIQTLTTGIYKAWLGQDNRIAAAQMASVLLLVVAVLLKIEHAAQARRRFASGKGLFHGAHRGAGARAESKTHPAAAHTAVRPHQTDRASQGRGCDPSSTIRLRGGAVVWAWLVCGLPVALGFVAPVLILLRPMLADWGTLPLAAFAQWAGNTVRLGAVACVLTVAIALGLAFAKRRGDSVLARVVHRLASLGYAMPGAVVVVGLLLPVAYLQASAPSLGVGFWITATSIGVLWAYVVRFTAVALQSVDAGYALLPKSLDDSARMLGAGAWQIFTTVHWPLLKRPVSAAALLVVVDVMKELPATLVLRPFESDTLAVMAYQLARDERLGEAAVPALAIVVVGLLPVLLLSRALRR
jgi:iron(III) transport system permease protein